MAETSYTATEDQFILDNAGKLTFREIGKQLGRNRHQVRGRYLYLKESTAGTPDSTKGSKPAKASLTVEQQGDDRQTLSSFNDRIKTVDDLIRFQKIDLDLWQVKQSTATAHEGFYREISVPFVKNGKKGWRRSHKMVTMHSVKIWLERRTKGDLAGQKLREELIEAVRKAAPLLPPVFRPVKHGEAVMLQLSIYDHHFGKLAEAEETGEEWNLNVADREFEEASVSLIGNAAGFNIDRIQIVVGQDLLHVDNMRNTTTAGTPQDCDGRWHKAFKAAFNANVKLAERCRTIAPVEIVVIPGNHDRERTFYLGMVLEAYFHNTPDVTVDNGLSPRKYKTYGANLIGLTHGNEEKPSDLPLLMAREVPALWAAALYHHWQIGHLHKKKEVQFNAGDTFNGVMVETLPSLCGTDAWHHLKGYAKGLKAATAHLWSKNGGRIATLWHNRAE